MCCVLQVRFESPPAAMASKPFNNEEIQLCMDRRPDRWGEAHTARHAQHTCTHSPVAHSCMPPPHPVAIFLCEDWPAHTHAHTHACGNLVPTLIPSTCPGTLHSYARTEQLCNHHCMTTLPHYQISTCTSQPHAPCSPGADLHALPMLTVHALPMRACAGTWWTSRRTPLRPTATSSTSTCAQPPTLSRPAAAWCM